MISTFDSSEGIKGWICPKCGRGLAPWASECPCYLENNHQTTCNTDSGSPDYGVDWLHHETRTKANLDIGEKSSWDYYLCANDLMKANGGSGGKEKV